ncbi:MAG: pyrimidine 5'-nucleotidase [Chloroflexi bacterium]|nr:pyrimidine 5'-nucleotidase [Chloroflexota bacterium]
MKEMRITEKVIRYILFDLDDTLYPTSAGMMGEISARMNVFMVERLGIPRADVARQRQDYWERYGTTLRGLYIERRIDPQEFLAFVHDIHIAQYLRPDARLDAMLAQLSQTKSVFTNAPADYARRVLSALGVERHFANIFDINFIEYQSKPTQFAYDKVIAALPVRADECLMIDDTARNLVPAKKLGMQTAWLASPQAWQKTGGDSSADHVIETIYDLAQLLL